MQDHEAVVALQSVQAQLALLREGAIKVKTFSTELRAQDALLAALPARYGEVLHDLLDRLESSAMFSEESCSFSQSGLLDNLQVWIDKALERLGPQHGQRPHDSASASQAKP